MYSDIEYAIFVVDGNLIDSFFYFSKLQFYINRVNALIRSFHSFFVPERHKKAIILLCYASEWR